MKYFFFFAVCCFSFLAGNAQIDAPCFGKHSVGINASTDFGSLLTAPQAVEGSYKPKHGNTVAALYQYRPVKWLSVESGVEYQANRFQKESIYPEGVMWLAPYVSIEDVTVHRIGVPVSFRGYLQHKRWSFYAMGQVILATNILRQHHFNVFAQTDRLNQLERNSFKENLGLGVGVGLGAEYAINHRWMLRLEPRFRVYNLLKTEGWRNYEMFYKEDRQWTAGFNFGVYHTFGKL